MDGRRDRERRELHEQKDAGQEQKRHRKEGLDWTKGGTGGDTTGRIEGWLGGKAVRRQKIWGVV